MSNAQWPISVLPAMGLVHWLLGIHWSLRHWSLVILGSLPQLPRLLGRRSHRTQQRTAHASFFQFVKSFDGCPARTGDHILESAGMQAGLQKHPGAAEDGLGPELR